MKRGFLLFLLIALIISAVVGFYLYNAIWSPSVSVGEEYQHLYIRTGSNFDDLSKLLLDKEILENDDGFRLTAKLMKFSDQNIRPGKYKLTDGWNNRNLISHLRSGKQEPINLTFNNLRFTEDLAGQISNQLEFDSISFLNYVLEPSNLEEWGVDAENILCQFLPNTYQVYWNTSVENLVQRLFKERDKWWEAEQRTDKAKALGLSKNEICTLAAIVEKETLVAKEKSTVAGVYVNRLKRGMMLQADPTVVYAVGDFGLRRVLNKHLEIDSPYNTYKYEGLPPGPIWMPETSTLEAVLNPEEHRYLYFCARTDNSGAHDFSKNLIEHNQKAKKYQRWLSNRGILR